MPTGIYIRTKQAKENISKAAKKRLKNSINHPFYKKHHTKETKDKISKSVTKIMNNPDMKIKISKLNKIRFKNDDERMKVSKGVKKYYSNLNEEEKNNISFNKIKNREISKYEKIFYKFLNKHFPKQWRYVGNGKLMIGGKCPDFKLIGKKRVVELSLFKNKEIRNRNKLKSNIYKQNKYKVMFVYFFSEIRKEDYLIEKINNFIKNKIKKLERMFTKKMVLKSK